MKHSRRFLRDVRIGWKALPLAFFKYRPILAHLVAMRRCNLDCAYCNEFDAVSAPVPLGLVERRVDRLSELGTCFVTISGGEPLLHPDLDRIVARVRERRMIPTLITNGYYLSRERVLALNQAGLDHLQISIDNLEPDPVSKKSWRLLEPKLRWVSELARFTVTINSVLGGGGQRPEEVVTIMERARGLGFATSLGIAHGPGGQLRPLGEREMAAFQDITDRFGKVWPHRFNVRFQENLARGLPNSWSCRAGARYLYVDEHGIVSYCSQQRGTPGIPIESYTKADLRREFDTEKGCAPYCTVSCVQQVALADRWRAPQTRPARSTPAGVDELLAD
jgi:hypothetical protein